jgi:hypothetical protein
MKDGKYLAVAIDTALAVSDNGTEQVAVQFRLSGGQEDAGQTITWYGYCTDAAMERTVKGLRNMGWTGNDVSVFECPTENEVSQLLPNEVQLVLQTEEYNGHERLKVAWVNKIGIAVKNKLEGSAAKALGARMRAACAALPTDKSSAPRKLVPNKPAEQNVPADYKDDQLPF